MSLLSFDSFFIALTILLTTYGQIILKWRIRQWGALPKALQEKILFLFWSVLDPFVLSSLFAAFGAALSWMIVLTKFDLGQVYPFVALSFPLTLFASHLFLGETFSLQSALGSIIIVLGTIIAARGFL